MPWCRGRCIACAGLRGTVRRCSACGRMCAASSPAPRTGTLAARLSCCAAQPVATTAAAPCLRGRRVFGADDMRVRGHGGRRHSALALRVTRHHHSSVPAPRCGPRTEELAPVLAGQPYPSARARRAIGLAGPGCTPTAGRWGRRCGLWLCAGRHHTTPHMPRGARARPGQWHCLHTTRTQSTATQHWPARSGAAPRRLRSCRAHRTAVRCTCLVPPPASSHGQHSCAAPQA